MPGKKIFSWDIFVFSFLYWIGLLLFLHSWQEEGDTASILALVDTASAIITIIYYFLLAWFLRKTDLKNSKFLKPCSFFAVAQLSAFTLTWSFPLFNLLWGVVNYLTRQGNYRSRAGDSFSIQPKLDLAFCISAFAAVSIVFVGKFTIKKLDANEVR